VGADSAPPYFLAGFMGSTSKGREPRGRKRGEEKGKGREGERGRRGGEGDELQGVSNNCNEGAT